MTEQAPAVSRHDLEAKIVKRCWEDEEFREEFTADPVGAAVKYLEVPATRLPKIVVHQEAAGSWHIVLPAKPSYSHELSEADLEKVAGGLSIQTEHLLVIASTAAVATSISTSATVSLIKGW
jgi:hypothetical protein